MKARGEGLRTEISRDVDGHVESLRLEADAGATLFPKMRG